MRSRINTLFIHLLVTHLAFGPVISSSALAADGETGDNGNEFQEHIVESPSSGVQQVGSVIQGLGNQMLQMKRQEGQYAQQASMMAQLQPKTHPSKLFPQCRMPFARPTFPKNACQSPAQGKQQMTMQQSYQRAAARYEKFYDQMLSTATNTQTAGGVQCLKNARNNTMSNLNQQINSLQALSDRIKKENQKFRDNAQKILDKIKDSHGLLHGGAGSENIDARAANINSMFSPTCRNVIASAAEGDTTQAASAIIRGRGLLGNQGNDGARALVSKTRNRGNNFRSNKNAIVSDINQYLDNIRSEIQESGVSGLESGGDLGRALQETGLTSFRGGQGPGRITSTIQKEYSELSEYKQEVQEEINESGLDYDIPRMDNNFGVDFEHFEANAENFFRKQYVNNCVTGEGSTGIALDAEDILGSLSSNRVSNDNYIVNKYKSALKNILQSDQYIEDKLSEIRSLDKKFQDGIQLTYQNENSQRKTQRPYEYYRSIVQTCNQHYEQDDTFTASGEGVSAKKKVDRVKEQLNELKHRHEGFADRLVSEISDSLIRCNGAKLKQGVNSCSSEVFEPSSSRFCVEHAQQCSNRINQCYGEIQNVVKEEKQKMKAHSQAFNQKVESFVANQERILKSVKGRLQSTQEALKKFFPGADYNLAKDLFIEMPEKKNAEMLGQNIGIKLRGGGAEFLQNLEQLPRKIAKLKKQLNEQKGQVDKVIQNHIQEQRTAMNENKQKWQRLHDDCQRSIASFRRQKQKEYQEKMKDFQDRKNQVAKFCSRYNMLGYFRNNPTAACDGEVESLMDSLRGVGDMKGAQGHITKEARLVVTRWKSMCHTAQSETPSIGSDSDDDTPLLKQYCEDDEKRERISIPDGKSEEIKEDLVNVCLNSSTNDTGKKNCLNDLTDEGIITLTDTAELEEKIEKAKKELNDARNSSPIQSNKQDRIDEAKEKLEGLIEEKEKREAQENYALTDEEIDICKVERIEKSLYANNGMGSKDSDYYQDNFHALDVASQLNDELESQEEDQYEDRLGEVKNELNRVGELHANSSCKAIAGQQRSTGNPMMDRFQEAFGGRDPAGTDTIFR